MSPACLAGWLRGFAEGIGEDGPSQEQLKRLIDVASSCLTVAPKVVIDPETAPLDPKTLHALNKKGGSRKVRPDLASAPDGVDVPKVERYG